MRSKPDYVEFVFFVVIDGLLPPPSFAGQLGRGGGSTLLVQVGGVHGLIDVLLRFY